MYKGLRKFRVGGEQSINRDRLTSCLLSSSFSNLLTKDLTPSGLKNHSLPKTNLLIVPLLAAVVEIIVREAVLVPARPPRWADGAKAILTSATWNPEAEFEIVVFNC